MDIQLNEITMEENFKISMNYTKWHAGVYNIWYFDSLRLLKFWHKINHGHIVAFIHYKTSHLSQIYK